MTTCRGGTAALMMRTCRVYARAFANAARSLYGQAGHTLYDNWPYERCAHHSTTSLRAAARAWRGASMAQPWGAAGGAWVAGVAAALEAAQQGQAGVDVHAAAAAVQAAAATAAWPGQAWGDPISPTELDALLNSAQWPQAHNVPAPAPPQAQPQATSGWRCLDRTHDPACTR